MSPKFVISSLSPSCLCVCMCVFVCMCVCMYVCVCNYVNLYSKISAGSLLLRLTCHHCHCTFRISFACICHFIFLKYLFLLFSSRQNYHSSFKTQLKCHFHHGTFLEFSWQLVALVALSAYLYHSFHTMHTSVFPMAL